MSVEFSKVFVTTLTAVTGVVPEPFVCGILWDSIIIKVDIWMHAYAFLLQVPHEKLQANQGEHTQTEDSQDHHI